jgi:transcriptional regulator with XRE-family HTH domain
MQPIVDKYLKEMLYMSIGERICTLRKERNISQAQLAKILDVSRQAVSKWENDLCAPDTIKLIQLADILNTEDMEAAREIVQADIDIINDTMPSYKQIRRFALTDEPMEKTTTGKIKRYVAGKQV